MRDRFLWVILAIVMGFSYTPIAFASVCVSDVVGSTPYGGNFGPYDGNDYAVPFTVAANCDVTDIKLEVKIHTGISDGLGFVIWDSSHNVLASGAGVIKTGACTLLDSTVAAGTYTLTSGNTYYIGQAYTLANTTAYCGLSDGDTAVNYWAAGWNPWVANGVHFEVDGVAGGGGGGGGGTASSTDLYATSTVITYDDWLFVNAIIIFLLSLIVFGMFFVHYTSKKPFLWS